VFKNFSINELRCKGSGLLILAPGFGEELQALRDAFGKPMTINSACRSLLYNKQISGHPRSLHICDYPPHETGGCCAVDVATAVRPKEYREELQQLAWDRGWSIGLGNTFLHLDLRIRYTKLPKAMFVYGSR
jgi:hypothetical protein